MVPFCVKCNYVTGICTIRGRMPADTVSLVTTGLGVSVLAGILSGVVYVLAHSFRRNRKKTPDWCCSVCGALLPTTPTSILDDGLVTCGKCGARACTSKCSRFVRNTQWICLNCLRHPSAPSSSWLSGILDTFRPNSDPTAVVSDFGRIMMEADLRKLENEQIRDFIEKLVNVMLGEDVDSASVARMYHDHRYQDIFDRYHPALSDLLRDLGSSLLTSLSNNNDIQRTIEILLIIKATIIKPYKMFLTVLVSVAVTLYILFCIALYTFYYFVEEILDLPITGQSPCTAHAALKQLIEKLLKEAVNLPLLQKAHAAPTENPPAAGTYEDLLATAIINKVITSCQHNLPSSSANSVSSRVSSSSRNRHDKEYFFGEETLESKWKTTDLDTTSVSSLEDWIFNESGRKYKDKVTLTIKQDIEEIDDNSDFEDDADDADYFRSSSSLLNDSESNWVLQKRHFQGTPSPVPVPMLVPHPSTEAKVLIGDKPLDDTSDLSDVGSDFEEDAVAPSTAHSLLVQSKNLIGGGNGIAQAHLESVDVRSESSTDSGVVKGHDQNAINTTTGEKADASLDDDNVEDSSFISVCSNTEKLAEYTERYASLPRQVVRESSLHDDSGVAPDQSEERTHIDEDAQFIGGSYSKKEKEKWNRTIEMTNNPYTKENIEKRVKRSSSAAGSLFGPDYYAKLAGKPSGGGKHPPSEINGVSWPPRRASPSTPSPPPEVWSFESQPIPEPPKSVPPAVVPPRDGVHQAVKAVVMPYSTASLEEPDHFGTYTIETKRSEERYVSDSESSFVHTYDVAHAQTMHKSRNEDVVIPIKAPPSVKPRYTTNNQQPLLRRHLSDSNLLDDGYGAPKVLHQKKDNTLISKIYKDPKVRLFAMHSREEVPYQSQSGYDHQKITLNDSTAIYLSSKNNHNGSEDGPTSSDYESGKTGRMSFFSSEEDLLSLNSDASTKQAEAKNERVHYGDYRAASLSSPLTPGTLSTRKFIYGSQEDLLSVDSATVESLPRKKDNTLISKIYKDPNVRKFALETHKDFVPEEWNAVAVSRKQQQQHQQDELKPAIVKRTFRKQAEEPRELYKSYDDLSSAEISLEPDFSHYSVKIDGDCHRERSDGEDGEDGYQSEDLDIEEVAKRHVVRQALGKFSKSEVHIAKTGFHTATILSEAEPDGKLGVSVRDLRKKFENNNTTSKPVVSSLTARSLSKQVKESLKH